MAMETSVLGGRALSDSPIFRIASGVNLPFCFNHFHSKTPTVNPAVMAAAMRQLSPNFIANMESRITKSEFKAVTISENDPTRRPSEKARCIHRMRPIRRACSACDDSRMKSCPDRN